MVLAVPHVLCLIRDSAGLREYVAKCDWKAFKALVILSFGVEGLMQIMNCPTGPNVYFYFLLP